MELEKNEANGRTEPEGEKVPKTLYTWIQLYLNAQIQYIFSS